MVGGEVPSWCDNSAFALGYNGCLFRALFAPQMLWWEHYRETDRAATAMAVASRAPAARTRLEGVVAPSRRSGATLVPLTLENVTLSAPPFGAGRLADAPEGFVVNGAWQAVRGDAQSSQTRIELAGETALSGTERGLLLLHGCETELVRAPTWNTADPYHHPSENLLAVYRMHHASGIVSDVDVHYGSHVARWDVPYGEHIDAVPFWADPVSIGRDPSGRQVTLYRLEWTNPRSDDPVVALEIEYTGDKTGALWLFAVTAVEIGTVGEIA
jgi:hypothetical protein